MARLDKHTVGKMCDVEIEDCTAYMGILVPKLFPLEYEDRCEELPDSKRDFEE